MDFWVYILRCSDGSYYVGSARGMIERRFAEHQSGAFDGYTAARLPVVLVFSEHFERVVDAIAAERQLKGWSRAKKEALISGRLGPAAGAGAKAKLSRTACFETPTCGRLLSMRDVFCFGILNNPHAEEPASWRASRITHSIGREPNFQTGSMRRLGSGAPAS